MVNRNPPDTVKVSFTFRPKTIQRLREVKEKTKLPMCRIVEIALEKNIDTMVAALNEATEDLKIKKEK